MNGGTARRASREMLLADSLQDLKGFPAMRAGFLFVRCLIFVDWHEDVITRRSMNFNQKHTGAVLFGQLHGKQALAFVPHPTGRGL